jgi:hypothetical protein
MKSNERKIELSNNEQTKKPFRFLVKTYLENMILLISMISRIYGFMGALFAIDILVLLLQAALK